MTLKQKIHQQYLQLVQDKIDVFKDMISGLTEDSKNDAKGSAGDKHETALAMLQIEQGNTRAQLHETLEQRSALVNINPDIITAKILPGSYVKTNKGNFYISVALGKLIIGAESVMAISPQSLLGAKLMGSCVNESVTINAHTYLVESIE